MPDFQAPFPLAMVVCDQVVTDPATGKKTLFGCFSVIGAKEFPVVHRGMWVYMALTDGRGKVPIKFQIVDVDEEHEPLFKADIELEFSDPRMVFELALPVLGVRFPEPGEYRMQLYAGSEAEEMIMERRIMALDLEEAK